MYVRIMTDRRLQQHTIHNIMNTATPAIHANKEALTLSWYEQPSSSSLSLRMDGSLRITAKNSA